MWFDMAGWLQTYKKKDWVVHLITMLNVMFYKGIGLIYTFLKSVTLKGIYYLFHKRDSLKCKFYCWLWKTRGRSLVWQFENQTLIWSDHQEQIWDHLLSVLYIVYLSYRHTDRELPLLINDCGLRIMFLDSSTIHTCMFSIHSNVT